MKTNFTFKDYLESKEKLKEAVNLTPQQTIKYNVSKYCKLIVGESKDEKEQINLKPNQTIVVEWIYEDLDSPTPIKITFEDVCPDIDAREYNSYWQSHKLQKWLFRNTHNTSN